MRLRDLIQFFSNLRIGGIFPKQTLCQCFYIKPCPADHQWQYLFLNKRNDDFTGHISKSHGIERLIRVNDVDEMMLYQCLFFRGGFCRSSVHFSIYLHGIGIYDFPPKPLNDPDRNSGFSDAGRATDYNYFGFF